MRTFILVVASIALLSSSAAQAQNSRIPFVPITIRAVHVQVEADAAAALKPEEGLQKLMQQAIKDAQSQSPSVQRSFLISTLINFTASANTGRRVQVVTGRAQSRDRVVESVTTVELGTLFSAQPRLVDGRLVLQVTYTSSSLAPGEKEEAPNDTGRDRPDIRKITVETTLAMEPDQPQLVKLNGDSDVDYLIITANWDAKAASESVPLPSTEGAGDQRPPLYPSGVAEAEGVEAVSDAVMRYTEALFRKYDTNKDGAIDAKEWQPMARSPEAADTDKDGRITLTEFAGYMQGRVDSARRARK